MKSAKTILRWLATPDGDDQVEERLPEVLDQCSSDIRAMVEIASRVTQTLDGIPARRADAIALKLDPLFGDAFIPFAKEVVESLDALHEHMADHPSHWHWIWEFDLGRGAEPSVKLLFTHPGIQGRTALWDRIPAPPGIPLAGLLLSMALDDELHAGYFRAVSEPPRRFTPGPMFAYHPERYCQTRRFMRGSGRNRFSMAVAPDTDLNELAMPIFEELQSLQREVPVWISRDHPPPTDSITQELSRAMTVGQFFRDGRRIFDFPESMVEAFGQTAVDDVPLGMLKLPYQSVYLHFGPQWELHFEDGWCLDGAYLTELETSDGPLLQIRLVTIHDDPDTYANWVRRPEQSIWLSFKGDERYLTAGEAIDLFLSRSARDLGEEITHGDAKLLAEAATARAQLRAQGVDAPRVRSGVSERARYVKDREISRRGAIDASMRLVINALAYLNAYPDDREERYPKHTPASRLAALNESKTQKAAKRNRSKLEALGYHPVIFCGAKWQEPPVVVDAGGERKVRTHWRRGHWRNQAHGPGRTLRKLIWVMPMRVGTADDGLADLGTLYLVADPGDEQADPNAKP